MIDDHLLVFEVVGDDTDDINVLRADLASAKQIVEAVTEAGDH